MANVWWPKDELNAAKADSAVDNLKEMAAGFAQRWATPEPPAQAAPQPDTSFSFGSLLPSLTPWVTNASQPVTSGGQTTGTGMGESAQPQSTGSLMDLLPSLTPWAPKPEPAATLAPAPAGAAPGAPSVPSEDAPPNLPASHAPATMGPVEPIPAATPAPQPTGEIDNSSRQAFVKSAWPYMLAAAGGNADAAQMMLAAAISENGSIGSGKPFWANNFFGIKGKGDAGSVNAATWEQTPSGPQNINDSFAAYSSPVAGFRAFFDFLQNNSRYAPALQRYQQTGDAAQLFRDVNAAGYATDPSWASKVESIRATQVAPLVAQTAGASPAPAASSLQPAAAGNNAAGASPMAYKQMSGQPEPMPEDGSTINPIVGDPTVRNVVPWDASTGQTTDTSQRDRGTFPVGDIQYRQPPNGDMPAQWGDWANRQMYRAETDPNAPLPPRPKPGQNIEPLGPALRGRSPDLLNEDAPGVGVNRNMPVYGGPIQEGPGAAPSPPSDRNTPVSGDRPVEMNPEDDVTDAVTVPLSYRQPLDGTSVSDLPYDPRSADEGAHEQASPDRLGPSSTYNDPEAGGTQTTPLPPYTASSEPTRVGGSPDAGGSAASPATTSPDQPESPLKPLYDLGGRIIGYVHAGADAAYQALEPARNAMASLDNPPDYGQVSSPGPGEADYAPTQRGSVIRALQTPIEPPPRVQGPNVPYDMSGMSVDEQQRLQRQQPSNAQTDVSELPYVAAEAARKTVMDAARSFADAIRAGQEGRPLAAAGNALWGAIQATPEMAGYTVAARAINDALPELNAGGIGAGDVATAKPLVDLVLGAAIKGTNVARRGLTPESMAAAADAPGNAVRAVAEGARGLGARVGEAGRGLAEEGARPGEMQLGSGFVPRESGPVAAPATEAARANLSPVGQDLMATYDTVTPQRVESATDRALQVASDAIAGQIPPRGGLTDSPHQLVQDVHAALVRNLDDTKTVMTGVRPGALAAYVRGEGLTSKVETRDLPLINRITQDQVNVEGGRAQVVDGKKVKVPYTLQDAADFAQRESEQHRAATGGTRFPDPQTGAVDESAPRVMYGYVGEGQPLVGPNKPTLWIAWEPDAPRVSSLNHPFGAFSPGQDIHANMAAGNKAMVYDPRAVAGGRSERVAIGPSGRLEPTGNETGMPLVRGWEDQGIPVGTSGRKIADTHLLVGPGGESDLRAAALLTGMPRGIQQAIARGKMTDPEQIAAVLMRGGSPQWAAGWGSVLNPTRTETLLVDPHISNARAIYITGTPAQLHETVPNTGGKTVLQIALQMRDDAIRASGGEKNVPILFTDITQKAASSKNVKAGLASNVGWAPPTINDAQLLAGEPLERGLSPGRGRIVDQYTRATDPSTGQPYTNIGAGVVPRLSPGVRAAAFNAAQGGVLGAASEDLQAQQEGREPDPGERLKRGVTGAVLAGFAGNRGAREAVGKVGADLAGAGSRVRNAFSANAERVAQADARAAEAGSTVASGGFGVTPGDRGRWRQPSEQELRSEFGTPIRAVPDEIRGPESIERVQAARGETPYDNSPVPPNFDQQPLIRDTSSPTNSISLNTTPAVTSTVGRGLPARALTDVSNSLGGGISGAAVGAGLPADTPEERKRNALVGAGVGMLAGPAAGRLMRRGEGGALATFGVNPNGPKIAASDALVARERARGAERGAALNRTVTAPGSSVPARVRIATAATDDRAGLRYAEDMLSDAAGSPRMRENDPARPSTQSRVNAGSVADTRIKRDLEPAIQDAGTAGLQNELPQHLEDMHQRDILAERYNRGKQQVLDDRAAKIDAARSRGVAQPLLDRMQTKAEADAEKAGQAAMRRREGESADMTWERIDARLRAQEERLTPEQKAQLEESAQAIWDHNAETRQRLVDAGEMSAEDAAYYAETYPHYVPTVPISHLDARGGGPVASSSNAVSRGKTPSVRALDDVQTSGERLNPIVATRNATVRAERNIQRNNMARAFAQMMDDALSMDPERMAVDAATHRTFLGGGTDVHYFEDGKPVTLSVPPVVAHGLEAAANMSADPGTVGRIWKRIMGVVTSAMTAGRASFLPVNLARDAQDYAIRTSALEGGPHRLAGVMGTWADEAGKAVADIARAQLTGRGALGAAGGFAYGATQGDENTPVSTRLVHGAEGALAGTFLAGANKVRATGKAAEYVARGGGSGGLSAHWGAGQRWYRDVMRDGGAPIKSVGDAAHYLGDWFQDIATLQGVKGINERTELISRTAAMRRADDLGIRGSVTTQYTTQGGNTVNLTKHNQRIGNMDPTEAMIRGRDASYDPDRAGTVARAINGIVPFFNATTQNAAQFTRLLRQNPVAASATIAATVAPVMLAAEAWNRSDPVRAQVYDDIPDYLKNTGIIAVTPWAGSDNRGDRPNYVWIPTGVQTPFIIGMRRAMEHLPGLEPTAGSSGDRAEASDVEKWANTLNDVIQTFSPLRGNSASSLASNIVPQGAKQAIELGVNRDLYRGSPVVTDTADERSSAASRAVAGGLNAAGRTVGNDWLQEVRPSGVEHLMQALPAYNDVVSGASDMSAPSGFKQAEDRPVQNEPFVGGIAGRFARDTGGANLERAQNERLPESVRPVLEDAGMRPSDVQPVGSTWRNGPLMRDEAVAWQAETNGAMAEMLARAQTSPKWNDPAAREALIRDAMMKARNEGARRAGLPGDAEMQRRIRDQQAMKAS